jgi:hypothetical protein
VQRPPLLLRARQERPSRHSLLQLLSEPDRAALYPTGHLLGWQHGPHGVLLPQHQLL